MFFLINAESAPKGIVASFVKDGKRQLKLAEYKPKLYIPRNDGSFQSIFKEPLIELEFENIKTYRKFLKESKSNGIPVYGDIEPKYQFTRQFFKDNNEFDIKQTNITYFDIEVSSLSKEDRYVGFPEAHIAPIPIVSIAIYSTLNDKMTVYGLNPYDVNQTLFPHIKTEYIYVKDEATLLSLFASYLCNPQTRPDILYGWNSNAFDLPYIHNRMMQLGGEDFVKKLSPFRNVYSMNAMRRWQGQNIPYLKYNITGIPHLDMMDVYLKFSGRTGAFSLSLNSVATHDLNEKKLDYGTSRSLMDMFYDNHQRFIDYNIYDTYLLKMIDDKNDLSNKILGSAIENKCNLVDTLGTTKQWECILYNAYSDRGLITPPRKENERKSYGGGYVRDSIIGVKRWNKTFDFTSLYPNIMIGLNISIETLLDKYEEGCVTAPNNVYFSRKEQGVLAKCVEEYFIQRKKFQKLMREAKKNDDKHTANKYDVLQYITKIKLNSIYGSAANPFFLFFKQEIAETITAMGQIAIKTVADRLNLLMNEICETSNNTYFDYELSDFEDYLDEEMADYIVMGDTDSCALSFEVYVNKFLKWKSDKEITEHLVELYQNKISPEIQKTLTKLQNEYNFYKHTLNMNFETLTKTSIFLQKKRYLGHVVYDEGTYCFDYDNPKLKIKGVEGIKASTSDFFQEKFMEFYKLCLMSNNNDILRNYIKDAENEYKKIYVIEAGKPIKVKNLEKYSDTKKIYKLKTPEATKGSLIYNHYIKKMGLESKYNLLREGDYASLVKLKSNSGFKNINQKGQIVPETVICLPDDDVLPPELKIEDSIGYEEQFFKFFKSPCLDILKVMGVSEKKFKGII